MTEPSPITFFRAGDADPEALAGQTIAVIGYGNLGRSVALNLRDSGLEVVVGNIDDDYRQVAATDGFEVVDIADAVARADLVFILIPDEEIGDCYEQAIDPRLRGGAALCFASGYPLAFGLVTPPPDVDVLLLAPRMLGEEVRRVYVDRTGFFAYLSVEQDATERGWDRLLALALAVGSLERGAMRLSARDEALLDLLIEQTVGPYLGVAIQLAFHVGVEGGLPPEAMVLEMYLSGEMERTFATFREVGFYRSATWHGMVAQYGGYLRTLELDGDAMQRQFRHVLDEIRSGTFARKLERERAEGYPTLKAIESLTKGPNPITNAEDRVRKDIPSG